MRPSRLSIQFRHGRDRKRGFQSFTFPRVPSSPCAGGILDASDRPLRDAALRESNEEIGLPPEG